MRSDPATLRHYAPWMRLVDESLDEHGGLLDGLAANDEKQARKLSAHDEAFGLLYKDLETLQALMQNQVDVITETLRQVKLRLNGR